MKTFERHWSDMLQWAYMLGNFLSNNHLLSWEIPTYPFVVIWLNTCVTMFPGPPPPWPLLSDPGMDTWPSLIWAPRLWFFFNLASREFFNDRSCKINHWWPCSQTREGMKQTYRKRQRWKTMRVLAMFTMFKQLQYCSSHSLVALSVS